MLQKTIMERAPLLPLFQAGIGNGGVRVKEPLLVRFYQHLNRFTDHAELWEGLASLACLVSEFPDREPVTERIRRAVSEQKNGAFEGDSLNQLYIARALLAWNEYDPKKEDIRKLADWCRRVEADWDQVIIASGARIQPADWMDFFLRLYRLTGLKAILRLCSRLRSAAMDWTTILQGYEKMAGLQDGFLHRNPEDVLNDPSLDESDFQKRQCIIHHSEYLPDGMRYSTLAGIFSGNRQELSAGEKGWNSVRKYYQAICGGTTGYPFLSVNGSNQPVSSVSLSAWLEAFCVQLMTGDSEWALDEIIRIGMNGLQDILRNSESLQLQYHNIFQKQKDPTELNCGEKTVHTLARISRAIAGLYRHAITFSADSIRINYVLPGQYVIAEKRCVLLMTNERITIHSKTPIQADLMVYSSALDYREVTADIRGRHYSSSEKREGKGRYFRIAGPLNLHDSVQFSAGNRIVETGTHHQGVCFYLNNRLYTVPVRDEEWRWAVSGKAETDENGNVYLMLKEIGHWNQAEGIPADLPVRPKVEREAVRTLLVPYPDCPLRMTVLPKER